MKTRDIILQTFPLYGVSVSRVGTDCSPLSTLKFDGLDMDHLLKVKADLVSRLVWRCRQDHGPTLQYIRSSPCCLWLHNQIVCTNDVDAFHRD